MKDDLPEMDFLTYGDVRRMQVTQYDLRLEIDSLKHSIDALQIAITELAKDIKQLRTGLNAHVERCEFNGSKK